MNIKNLNEQDRIEQNGQKKNRYGFVYSLHTFILLVIEYKAQELRIEIEFIVWNS